MKKIVLITLIILTNSLFAQKYSDSLFLYFDKKDFKKAVYFANKGIKYNEDIKDTINLDYAYCMFYNAYLQPNESFTESSYSKSLLIFKWICK